MCASIANDIFANMFLNSENKSLPDLPEGYYLEHFLTFVRNVDAAYSPFLAPDERALIDGFLGLTEPSQRLFVRLCNRKGPYFFCSELKYPEIDSLADGIADLLEKGFLRRVQEAEYFAGLSAMKKRQLSDLLKDQDSENSPRASRRKEELLLSAKHRIPFSRFEASPVFSDMIVMNYATEWSFLCFLAFGDLGSDLKLYALRDLGILAGNGKGVEFRPRFDEESEARSEFFYRLLREKLRNIPVDELALELSRRKEWPEATGPGALRIREKIIYDAAESLRSSGENDFALEILAMGSSPRTIERRLRILWTQGRVDEAKRELEAIIQTPASQDLLLFAEDLMLRKFGVERVSAVTRALRGASTIRLSGIFRGRPEEGVRTGYEIEGRQAFRSENELWLSLFGTVFWSELFESPTSAVHSEFDILPADLLRGTFYSRNRTRIEEKVEQLNSGMFDPSQLSAALEHSSSRPNGLVSRRPGIELQLREFLTASRNMGARPGSLLRGIAENFEANKRGFPDLLILENGRARFVEVKTLGDRLQPVQLRQLLSLSAAGYPTDIVRVEWEYDPDQTYVVIDVETTGGPSDRHRMTEISALKFRGGEVIGELTTLLNPERRISSFITGLTGISNEMVKDAPVFAEIAEQLSAFLGGAIFVAHNAPFDAGFVSAELRRAGLPFRFPTFCTRVEMRRAFPGLDSYSLKDLTRYFGIPLEGHHRARNDAVAALELLKLILQKNISGAEQGLNARRSRSHFIE